MEIYEKSLNLNDDFEAKILTDLCIRQKYLALKMKVDDDADLTTLLMLLNQMDLIYTDKNYEIEIWLPEFSLLFFKNQLAQKFNNSHLNQQMETIIKNHEIIWQAGRFKFKLMHQPIIYGILNVTPDSFYDGGWYENELAIFNRIQAMVNAGVNVIEVGGQTTRPGFSEISVSEEIKRVAGVIKLIHQKFKDVAIALDTYKYGVMEALINQVDIINDVNAFTDDQRKLPLIRDAKVGLLTMHNARNKDYQNLTQEMKAFFEENITELVQNGIDINRIAIDQGIGYAKKADGYQDYAMMRNIDQFNYLKRPIMVAISRKGFGAKLFGLKKEDRLPVTLVSEAYMYLHGGRILRVHDIEETVQLTKMLDVIQNGYWLGRENE